MLGRRCSICCSWCRCLSCCFSPQPSPIFCLLSLQHAAFLPILCYSDLAKMQYLCFARCFCCCCCLLELRRTEICINYFCKPKMEVGKGFRSSHCWRTEKGCQDILALMTVFQLWLQEARVHVHSEIVHEHFAGIFKMFVFHINNQEGRQVTQKLSRWKNISYSVTDGFLVFRTRGSYLYCINMIWKMLLEKELLN